MTVRRRIILAVGLIACLGLAAWEAVRFSQAPKPAVTLDNCRRLRVGMREAEVEAVLGPPDGPADASGNRDWKGERCRVQLRFDASGAVTDGIVMYSTAGGDKGCLILGSLLQPPSFWDQLRGTLPW
jgi:hypothetical protein